MKSIQGMTRFRKKFENSSIKVQIINYTPFPIYFKIELNKLNIRLEVHLTRKLKDIGLMAHKLSLLQVSKNLINSID